MTEQHSPTEHEPWWARGLTPNPEGNPPDVPPDYLYDPKSNTYWSPQKPWFISPRTTPPIIDRRVLPNGEIEEWERAFTIPDDFIYDPETHSYYPPGEPGEPFDSEAWLREFREEWDKRSEEERHPGLFNADELRAAGAFDVPPEWRKSLSAGTERTERKERNLFTGMPWDEDPSPAEQAAAPPEPDEDGSTDERR